MNLRDGITESQLALMILTRLPAGKLEGDPPPTADAAWAFPLVGALIGAISGLVFWLATTVGMPPPAAALLAIGTSALSTGALHEDGLADVADGFGGGQEKDRKLEIMRDSHLGSYGTVALFLILGLTATGMAAAGSASLFIAIGALSRTAMLLPMAFLPPAREDGLGHAATLRLGPAFAAALLLTALLCLPTLAIWPVIAALGATLVVMALSRNQIGGQTGDVLGATQKIAECAAWLAAACTL